MVVVPAEMPVTSPDPSTVATLDELLVHVPPEAVSDKVIADDWQTVVKPEIIPGAANGFTVTVRRAAAVPHALVTVYDITAVPAETPVTAPVTLTVATAVLLELQVPPEAPSTRVIMSPTHTEYGPEMLPPDASVSIATGIEAETVPQLFVTV